MSESPSSTAGKDDDVLPLEDPSHGGHGTPHTPAGHTPQSKSESHVPSTPAAPHAAPTSSASRASASGLTRRATQRISNGVRSRLAGQLAAASIVLAGITWAGHQGWESYQDHKSSSAAAEEAVTRELEAPLDKITVTVRITKDSSGEISMKIVNPPAVTKKGDLKVLTLSNDGAGYGASYYFSPRIIANGVSGMWEVDEFGVPYVTLDECSKSTLKKVIAHRSIQ